MRQLTFLAKVHLLKAKPWVSLLARRYLSKNRQDLPGSR
jgi:hypothetical protein